MNFLVGSLLTSTLFIIFKAFGVFKVNTFQAVVINYWTCALTGLIYTQAPQHAHLLTWEQPWVKASLGMGFLFISTFYLTGYVAQKISVATSSIAAKTSLVIPVMLNLFLFSADTPFDILNFMGLALVIVAIFLTSSTKKTHENQGNMLRQGLLLILILFVMSGLIDTLLNYISKFYAVTTLEQALFSALTFTVAALAGTTWIILKKNWKFSIKTIAWGVSLGVINYFSVIYMIRGLQLEFKGNGAFFFPVFNIAIILMCAVMASLLFKEKMTRRNQIGVVIALIAIVFISHQSISAYLK